MDPGRFFAELRRRNVYKVAVAYAIVAWLLIQIATFSRAVRFGGDQHIIIFRVSSPNAWSSRQAELHRDKARREI
jgi:hypothetical protein